jgi:hypothetical protein
VKRRRNDVGTLQNPSSPGLSGRANLLDHKNKWVACMKQAMTIFEKTRHNSVVEASLYANEYCSGKTRRILRTRGRGREKSKTNKPNAIKG